MWKKLFSRYSKQDKRTFRRKQMRFESLERREVFAVALNSLSTMGIEGSMTMAGSTIAQNGDFYTAGYFGGTVDFDPQASKVDASDIKTSQGDVDFFIAKYAASGSLLWVRTGGGTSKDMGAAVDLDASGNVLFTGQFTGTATVGNSTFNSVGQSDGFIAKLDTNGNYLWSRTWGFTENDFPTAIEVDASGNSYVQNNRFGVADDVIKYDKLGKQVWLRSVADKSVFAGDMVIDSSGNPIVIGSFQGLVDFDPGSRTKNLSSVNYVPFIWKLTAAGNFSSVTTFGTSGGFGMNLAIDANDNLYTSGTHYTTIDVDPTAGVTSLSGSGAFIAKLNKQGSLLWGRNFERVSSSNSGTLLFSDMEVDSAGGLWIAGSMNPVSDTATENMVVDFATGPEQLLVTMDGKADSFLAHFTATGTLDSVDVLAGPGASQVRDITVASDGSLLVVGYFTGTVDFNTDPILSMSVDNPNTTRAGFWARYRRV